MAPATPNRPSTAGRTQHATPPEEAQSLAEELQEVPMETDEEEGDIQNPPIHPNSHEDEVKKLKKKLRNLGEQHNTLLDNAKNNAKIAQNRIEALEKKVADLAEIAESLGKTAEHSQKLYKEHIEHTQALVATGKDPGEILRPRQPDSFNGDADKLQGFLTSLRSYQIYYPIQFTTEELRVRHGMGFLKDKALRMMEPIIRDYRGSAADYLAEYRYQAAKLNWGEEAHMAQVYLGLKSEVKDAMVNIRPKPKNLNELANIAGKQPEALQQIDDIPVRVTLRDTEQAFQKEREAGAKIRTYHHRRSRHIGHRGGIARETARYLRKQDERLNQKWQQPYEQLFDETGNRMWTSQEDKCIQEAREHGETSKFASLNIRAYHIDNATNPHHKEPKFNVKDDLSCKYHWCKEHRRNKEDNNCFPVTIPGTPNDKPYLATETEGYLVHLWYENLGVAELRFHMPYYREIQKNKNLCEGIKQMTQEITDVEEELEALTLKESMKQERHQEIPKRIQEIIKPEEKFEIIDLGKYQKGKETEFT
ncbi:uncharacterized protein FRV6_11657 [Fusarium oxysporum]|uniref:Retrotransposon gag domain-containing protein n=1 Tax=Fusarium oxysporum TaxID=5507 RepID=A0A2H3TRV2_FUSOX|nr:uncharacterized protein FRV6_11657 [Fusarium oxysporum]